MQMKPKHCGKPMHRMYIRKGTKDRKWFPVGYYCSVCTKMIRNVDVIMHTRREAILSKPDFVSNPQIIILDIGECLTKVGFGGEKEPRFIFDSILYYDENNKSFIQKSDYLETKRTIKSQVEIFDEAGSNFNLEAGECFLNHVFEALEVNPENKSIVILEKSYKNNYVEYLYGRKDVINNTTLSEEIREKLREKKRIEYVNYDKYVNFPRRKITTLLFDSFKIARIYFSNGELLSLYTNKVVTGLVVNIGAKTTRIIPVFEGFIVTHAISVRDVGTEQVLDSIKESLDINQIVSDKSNHLQYLANKRIRLASEEFCYISLDLSSEKERSLDDGKLQKHINLFNDKYVVFDQLRFLATESLFKKEELSTTRKKGTLAEAIIETVQKCDIDLVTPLFGSILLTGGGTLYEGMEERLKAELITKVPKQIGFNIISKPNRLNSSWTGGSILCSLKTFNKLWVTKEEYNEKGSSAVDRCI